MTTTKRCYACGITKEVTEFYRSNKHYFQKECKECNRVRKQKWHKTDKGKRSSANTKLKARFGITVDDYDQMYKEQNGSCLCCGVSESTFGHRLAIDHCHETGVIRGLLCKNCNVALGHIKENSETARNLLTYIENVCIPTKNNLTKQHYCVIMSL